MRTGSCYLLIMAIVGFAATFPSSWAQETDLKLVFLTGDDKEKANTLLEKIDEALGELAMTKAAQAAQELADLRLKVQGKTHYETQHELWRAKTLSLLAKRPEADQKAYLAFLSQKDRTELLLRQGQYREAETLARDSWKTCQSLFGDEHPATAGCLNGLGSALQGQGKPREARTHFEQALAIERKVFDPSYPEIAIYLSNLATTLGTLGQYEQATPMLEEALAIKRMAFSSAHPSTLMTINNLVNNLFLRNQFEKVQTLSREALATLKKIGADNSPLGVGFRFHLGSSLDYLGNYREAQPYLEEAVKLSRQTLGEEHPQTTTCLGGLVDHYRLVEEYPTAQALLEKTLALSRQSLGEEHPQMGTIYNSLANLLLDQEKNEQALPLFRKTSAIYHNVYGPRHPFVGVVNDNMAQALVSLGQLDEAQKLSEQALEIFVRTYTENSEEAIEATTRLGIILSSQGKHAEAQAKYERSIMLSRRLFGENHPLLVKSLYSSAHTYEVQGQHAQAQRLYEQAIKIGQTALPKNHKFHILLARNYANNLFVQGKYAESLQAWRQSIQTYECKRSKISLSGLDRSAFSATQSPFARIAVLEARANQPVNAWSALESHLGRGLLDELANRQNNRWSPQDRDELKSAQTTLLGLDQLFETWEKTPQKRPDPRQIQQLRTQQDNARVKIVELRAKLAQTHGILLGQTESVSAIQKAIPPNSALITWVDQAPLSPQAADPDGDHWAVVLKSQGPPIWLPISGSGPNQSWTKPDEQRHLDLRLALSTPPRANTVDWRALAQIVGQQRLAPIRDVLQKSDPAIKRLIVLPSRMMTGIPLEVLMNSSDPWTVSYAPSATILAYLRGQPPIAKSSGLLALGDPVFEEKTKASELEKEALPERGLLIRAVVPGGNADQAGIEAGDVLMSYHQKDLNTRDDLKVITDEKSGNIPASIWRSGQKQPKTVSLKPGKLGVVIDPKPAPVALREQKQLEQTLATLRSGSETFKRLPGTRYEVEQLRAIFAQTGRPVQVLLDSNSSERQLQQLKLDSYGFLHFATHGVIDNRHSTRSAVILSNDRLPDPFSRVLEHLPIEDGRINVREIQENWTLNAELVTLSACETAKGEWADGEGFIGFSQALLIAGARSVCLSHWKVNDAATALLMRQFYKNLIGTNPLPKAEALSQAKRWLQSLTRDQANQALANLTAGEPRGGGDRGKNEPLEAPKNTNTATVLSDRPFGHPYYWAGFALIGNPD